MSLEKQSRDGFFSPRLTGRRAYLALAIAAVADLLQMIALPVAWTLAQSVVDVVAMLLVLPVLGFHILLLPTFLIEFVPGAATLPTWTGCVLAVIALKRRSQSVEPEPNPIPPPLEGGTGQPPRQLNEPPVKSETQ